jgi:hypothetical protein
MEECSHRAAVNLRPHEEQGQLIQNQAQTTAPN